MRSRARATPAEILDGCGKMPVASVEERWNGRAEISQATPNRSLHRRLLLRRCEARYRTGWRSASGSSGLRLSSYAISAGAGLPRDQILESRRAVADGCCAGSDSCCARGPAPHPSPLPVHGEREQSHGDFSLPRLRGEGQGEGQSSDVRQIRFPLPFAQGEGQGEGRQLRGGRLRPDKRDARRDWTAPVPACPAPARHRR